MILTRSHIYGLEDLMDTRALADVFNGMGEVVTDRLEDVHCWSINMHKSIMPHKEDFYEQLGYMVLFLVTDQELWFKMSDPQLIFFCKQVFIGDKVACPHYIQLIKQYLCQCHTNKNSNLLDILIQALNEFKGIHAD